MNVVIVESPGKAKTINNYLGKDFKVMASVGHVRDLPAKDGSVEPDNDFAMHWDLEGRGAKVMKEIAAAVKGASRLILATDPDREGEAISWHILQVLADKKALKGVAVQRVAFNAITKQAIMEAMKHPREIDEPLVSAYLARRALDYLVGFNLSPVLWRKLPGARSAGRVQSVALRLICDREDEIERFKTEEYWTIEATLATIKGEEFRARLVSIAGTTLKKLDLKNETSATAIKAAIEGGDFKVASADKKPVKRNPYPPFTTSTLQMDASRKLGMSAKQTMQVAQKLYEGVDVGGESVGLITYMRTDGVQIVPEAVSQIRDVISAEFGRNYTPFAREWKTKAKNAQEAHEAIRPTDPKRTPDKVRRYLDREQAALYELIWKRTIASQMAPAEMEQTTVEITVQGRDGKPYGLRANGSVMTFDGFLRVYQEGRDERTRLIAKGKEDTADSDDDESRRLPVLQAGDRLKDRAIDADQHFTQPPPRFTESSLVKRMEELGIGRPSTYASTLAVLRDRDYVRLEKKQLVPEDKGRLVTAFLEGFFRRYVEYDFTADLEEKLDLISDAKLDWKQVLRDFWKDFTAAIDETKELRVSEVLEKMNELLGPHIFPAKEDGSDPRACPSCNAGRLSLKPGKFGPFVGCSNYPECRYTRQFSAATDGSAESQSPDGKLLGTDSETGLPVTVRSGRFGTYLQLGDQKDYDEGEKPKRSSIPKGIDAATIDLEKALQLLRLPREVGVHPETGNMITAGLGRYGPFILHDGKYANLDGIEDVFSVGINRAVAIIAEKAAGGGKSRFGRAKPTALRTVGDHPDGGKIEVFSGRYGPYLKHGDINATLPKSKDPATVTLGEAVEIIAERVAKGGGKPARKAKAPAKKPTPKKAAAATAKPKAAAKPKSKARAKSPVGAED
jgi:DNA topoisomerase-1